MTKNKIFLMQVPAAMLMLFFFRAAASAQSEKPVENSSPEGPTVSDPQAIFSGSLSMSRIAVVSLWLPLFLFLLAGHLAAQDAPAGASSPVSADVPSAPVAEGAEGQFQKWNWHAQFTGIGQGYPSFSAQYSGPQSLPTAGQARETLSMDLYGGLRLWKGAEAHVDLMTWQGFGLNDTFGIDDFPNGEAFKFGTGSPKTVFARLFVQQTIGLGGSEMENIAEGETTLASRQPVKRLTFTLGRFSVKDIFDNNSYANDARRQFMNWALMANCTWDYPADSLGYTTGVAMELNEPKWTLRYGFFQLARIRNWLTAESQYLMFPGDPTAGDGSFFNDWGMVTEFERRYQIAKHPGAVRPLVWMNQGNFASYLATAAIPGAVISPTQPIRHAYGFGLNWEQELTEDIGVFSRLGWNNGQTEAWNFTDANDSGSFGVSVKGRSWKRPGDTVGVAGVFTGISRQNQLFLQAGGLGILDGDGALTYGKEKVMEIYYDYKVSKHINTALDYQFVDDPNFNQARGPVNIFAMRWHWEY